MPELTSCREEAGLLFANVHTNEWPEDHVEAWVQEAGNHLSVWETLEEAWQRAGCPDAFTWPILRQGVLHCSTRLNISPLETLNAFLFPPQAPVGYEGFWLDWQTEETKKDVYRTAEMWMASTTDWDGQAVALLNLARDTRCMEEWYCGPLQYVKHLDWYKAMMLLNCMPADILKPKHILRVPWNGVPLSQRGAEDQRAMHVMAKCSKNSFRNVARCLEDRAGPGLWLHYVLDGPVDSLEDRRRLAWNAMRLDGLDAWALAQFYKPSSSFEQSLDGIASSVYSTAVVRHSEWAHRWWIQCALGMTMDVAIGQIRAIHSVEAMRTMEHVDTTLFLA